MTELHRTDVDLAGLLDVLGHNLYSTPMVALRELVQNGHDSCRRRQLEDSGSFEPRIVVDPQPDQNVLRIVDTGAGLTRDEIVKDLATIGTGYTRRLRRERGDTATGDDVGKTGRPSGLIGRFGLGFLSALFVSARVTVRTTSYQTPETGLEFDTKGGERYVIKEIPAREIGTEVILHLKDNFSELSDPERIERLLTRYCLLLPFPVHQGSAQGPAVNVTPPWRDSSLGGVMLDKKLREFAGRFEHWFEPIDTIPLLLEDDDPDGLQGVLWIQDGATYGNADNRTVWVYVRGMQVSSDARELLPGWATFCGAILESTSLTPTASREDFQRDQSFHRTRERLLEALVEGLADIARNKPATWRRILRRHNEALLGSCLAEPRLFDLLADELTVPTTEGDLKLEEIRLRGKNKIHVMMDDRGGYEDVLFRATMVPVVLGNRYAALPFCKLYGDRNGAQLVQMGTSEGDRNLFPQVDVSREDRTKLERLLGADNTQVIPTRYQPSHLPVILVPDREVELKQRMESEEADKRISTALLGLARMHTASIDGSVAARLYVNMSSPLIQELMSTPPEKEQALGTVLQGLAALVSRGGTTPDSDVGQTLERFSEALTVLVRGESSDAAGSG